MKKVLCFIARETCGSEIQNIIEKWDKSGIEVHLYLDILSQKTQPDDILYMLDQIYNADNKDEYFFTSDINNLFSIVYRIYHQLFDGFIYLYENNKNIQLNDIYNKIIRNKVQNEEELYKPIYVNKLETSHELDIVKMMEDQSVIKINIDNLLEIESKEPKEYTQKYYFMDNNYYLFEPVIGDKIKIELDYPYSIEQDYKNTKYIYDYNIDKINRLYEIINLGEFIQYKDVIYSILVLLENYLKGYRHYKKNITSIVLYDIGLKEKENIYEYIVISSFLIRVECNSKYINDLYEFAINSTKLNDENRNFIWGQLGRRCFEKPSAVNQKTRLLSKELYQKLYNNYKSILNEYLIKMPRKERNNTTIVIFVKQFLYEGHPPTKTALERCYTLGKLLNKDILLINTKELASLKGNNIAYYSPFEPNVAEEYNELSYYTYKDYNIPFYQLAGEMPDVLEMKVILEKVIELKPWYILSLWTGSIMADLCGEIIPEAAASVVFSSLPLTMGTFSIIGKQLTENEWNNLIDSGYKREEIIESKFTFELKEQQSTFCRKDYNIPQDKFVLAIVGTRLDFDIDNEFLEMLQKTFDYGTYITFVGVFDQYNQWCEIYPELVKNSTFIGYCEDMLAFIELTDLYINPRRLGGGFSIIEAFHHGKPGITLRYGDVAVSGGEDFCVDSYNEMVCLIKKYIEDKEFYKEMSIKARERERVMTDSKGAMEEILYKIENSPLFY